MWEYKTIRLNPWNRSDPMAELKVAGEEGWEAVGMAPSVDGHQLILLKRPKLDDASGESPAMAASSD